MVSDFSAAQWAGQTGAAKHIYGVGRHIRFHSQYVKKRWRFSMKALLTMLGIVTGLALLTIPSVAAETNVKPGVQKDNAITKMVWPAESRHGTIAKIDSTRKTITVKDTAGVPFDFLVGPSTKIESDKKDLSFGDLTVNANVTVDYKPEVKTDIAERIQVGS
jgi:hypothetical protein